MSSTPGTGLLLAGCDSGHSQGTRGGGSSYTPASNHPPHPVPVGWEAGPLPPVHAVFLTVSSFP